jgi:glucose dehydrogenase
MGDFAVRCNWCGAEASFGATHCRSCGHPFAGDGAAPLPFAGAKPFVVVAAFGALVALLVFIVVVDVRSRSDEAAPPSSTTTIRTTTTRVRPSVSTGPFATLTPETSTTQPSLLDGIEVIPAAVRWQVELPSLPLGHHWGTPHRVGELILVPSNHEGLVAIDPATHAVRWQVGETDHTSAGRVPAAAGPNTLLMTKLDEVVALDASTGVEKWSQATPFAVNMQANADHVILDNGATVASFDPNTGAKQWQKAFEDPKPLHYDQLLLLSTAVVVGAPGMLLSLDAASGQERWRVPVEGPDVHDIVGDDHRVIITFGLRSIAAYDVSIGAEQWHTAAPHNALAADVGLLDTDLTERVIVQAGPRLVALSALDGGTLWEAPMTDALVRIDWHRPKLLNHRLLLYLASTPRLAGVLVASDVGKPIGFLDFGAPKTVNGFDQSDDLWITVVMEQPRDSLTTSETLTAVTPL